jgi:hypothetical protein
LGPSAEAANFFLRTFTYIATIAESASDKITEGNLRLWISDGETAEQAALAALAE